MTLRALDFDEVLNAPPPAQDFVLPGLPLRALGIVVGSGGVGKTSFLLQLAMSLATGADMLGGALSLPTIPSRVVYVAAEESPHLLHGRLHALWHTEAGRAGQDAPELLKRNLRVYPGSGESVRLVRDGDTTEFLHELIRICEGARLVILDPLRRLHDGDENSSAAMTCVAEALERLAHRSGAAVLAAHHANKGSAFADADSAAISRGSSALTDAARLQMNLSVVAAKGSKGKGGDKAPSRILSLDIAKANYLPPMCPVRLKWLDTGVLVPESTPNARAGERGQQEEGVEYV